MSKNTVITKQLKNPCYVCDGTGKITTTKKCEVCKGTGVYTENYYYFIGEGICIGGDTLK